MISFLGDRRSLEIPTQDSLFLPRLYRNHPSF